MDINEKLNKVRENTLKKIEGTQDNQNDYFLNSIDNKINELTQVQDFNSAKNSFNAIKKINEIRNNPRKSQLDVISNLFSLEESQYKTDVQNAKITEQIASLENIKSQYKIDKAGNELISGYQKNNGVTGDTSRNIANYGFKAALKDTLLRGTAGAVQGLAGLGDLGAEKLNEMLLGDTSEQTAFTDIANFITSPLNELRKENNYRALVTSTDDITGAFKRDGIIGGLQNLGRAALEQTPSMLSSLAVLNPYGAVAFGSAALAEHNKEKQAEKLGTSSTQITDINSDIDGMDVLAAAGSTLAAFPEVAMLKGAAGVSKLQAMFKKATGKELTEKEAKTLIEESTFSKLANGMGLKGEKLTEYIKNNPIKGRALKALGYGLAGTGAAGLAITKSGAWEYLSEAGDEASKKLGNGDYSNKSLGENLKDINEAGMMGAMTGAMLGGGMSAGSKAIETLGSGIKNLNNSFTSKKETEALEKYTPAADKALAGGNTLFDKLDDEKFGENLSKEDIENYKADFNDIMNSSPDASIDDINNFLNDENNRDAVIKTIYLAKNGKLGSDAAKSIVESHNNLVNTILLDSNPNEAILNSKSILEKIMYAVNLRDTNFVRGLFNSAISKSNKDVLNSPENASNEVARTLETYIAIMENLRDTLSKGIEQTKSLLGSTYSETKDKASIAYMDKMINTIKKTPSQVGMEIIKSGFTTMDGNKKESVSDYMNFLNKTNDIDALRNKKTKLETYRNNHRAKVTLYQFLKNSNPIKQGNIAVIPRFSTNSNDIRVMSKQEFENELKRTNTPRNHFTIFESRFSNPKSYQTSVENLLNSIQNELDIMEQTYNDYEYKINRVSKQNSQNTTDNSSNKQDSKSNEKPKQEQSSTQSKQESKESETKSENNNLDPKPSEVKDSTKPKQTSNSNSEQTIDIYSTNKDTWSYLTNVTKLESPLVLNIGGQEYKFVSVEHAYQSLKHNDFSKPISEWTPAEVHKANWNNAIKIRSELKENRENDSNIKIMKYLLEERAKQDSKFKELLKETGNATLTHIKDNTIWKDKFPELLMEIRNELNSKNEQEITPSSNVEQEVLDQSTKENIINYVPSHKENIINFVKSKLKIIPNDILNTISAKLKEAGIKNMDELIKKVSIYGRALSNFIKENKNSKSQIATMGNITETAKEINREFSSIKQGFFDLFFTAVRGNKNNGGNLPGILGEIQENYNNKTFQLNSYTGVRIQVPKNGTAPFAEVHTAPGAILLHDNRTVLSMAIRGIETLTTLQFNKSRYMNNEEMAEHLQKVFGKDLDINLEYPVLKKLNEYSLENSLLLDIGRNIIKDLGLEFNQDIAGKEQESFIAQELGAYTINALEKIGFIDRTSLKNIDIFTNSNNPLAQLNLIKIKDGIFSKDSTNENSTKNILEKLTSLCEKLGIDRNQARVAHKFGKGFGTLDNNEHRTTKGKLKKLYKQAAKALQISRNTKFVAKSRGYLLDFFERNSITLDTINKASEGYTSNLNEKLKNLDKLNEIDTILLSEIENKKGKNLGIENENSYMWDMIHDERSESEGVFFDFRLSKNEREFIQSDGINPQSHKISRFLLVPEALFATYTKGENGEILYNSKEDNIAYQHIAQAFGMGTDKAARADSIAFGKSIVALDFNNLEKAMSEAMKKGKIDFEVDGVKLSIAELGHALSALSALSKFHNAKVGENFEAAILGEADGINNGIAIKLLQYMLHPQYIELLRGTGIDFVKQVSDKISDYFAGKVDDEEILDLYQTVARKFNNAISERVNNKEGTRKETLSNLKENDTKLANLINKEGNAISAIVDNITDSLSDIYKETDDGKVSKSSRNATKPIVQVFGYGAGDESQINGLISSLMEKIERGALDYINGKSTNDFYYNILYNIYYLVTKKHANPEDIKNALINGIEVNKQNSDEIYTTTLLSAKIEGTSVNGYHIIKSILKEQLQSTIKNTMMSTFPGIREQSQLINEITNQRISLVQKMFELKKEEKLKNSSRDYLTIRELKEIQDELRKDLPGITLSIAEKNELNNIEAKHYFENIKEKTSETTGSQIFLDNGSKKSLTINPKEYVYLDNGAGTNVIAIHQKDGSTILLTVVETAKENEKGKLIRTFLGVHDAVVVGSHNAIEVQQTMNRIAFEMDMTSKQLEEFEDIAKGNIEIAKKLGEKNLIVLETMAQIQEIFATISNFNRIMLNNYNVSYNNIQNGNEGSAYENKVKNALDPTKEGQSFKDTLIDFSFISSRLDDRFSNIQLPELLDAFNSNKMIIQRLSDRETLSEKATEKLYSALVAMHDISEGLKEYRKKLDRVMDEKLDNLGSIQTNTKNKIDKNIEVSFNTKYENTINAITRAINKNNTEGIKEAYGTVNGNERGFRTAISKYLNSLDNMTEDYKTNFKNKIKEALSIDIDKKLSKNEKAREEIEENITDENLKEALNKEIEELDKVENLELSEINKEFKEFIDKLPLHDEDIFDISGESATFSDMELKKIENSKILKNAKNNQDVYLEKMSKKLHIPIEYLKSIVDYFYSPNNLGEMNPFEANTENYIPSKISSVFDYLYNYLMVKNSSSFDELTNDFNDLSELFYNAFADTFISRLDLHEHIMETGQFTTGMLNDSFESKLKRILNKATIDYIEEFNKNPNIEDNLLKYRYDKNERSLLTLTELMNSIESTNLLDSNESNTLYSPEINFLRDKKEKDLQGIEAIRHIVLKKNNKTIVKNAYIKEKIDAPISLFWGESDNETGKGPDSGYGLSHAYHDHAVLGEFKTFPGKSIGAKLINATDMIIENGYVQQEYKRYSIWYKYQNMWYKVALSRGFEELDQDTLWVISVHQVPKEKIKKVPKTAIEFFDTKSRDRKTRSAVSNFKALQTTKASKDKARINSNKNKLKSAENIETNEEYIETTAISILDEIQSNPNAISEMQDNLRDLDKQNGRSIDEEHSTILKEVLNKVTGTLSQSVGDLKVLLSNTDAINNAGEYNREINAITIKHSTNPRYSGYMGAELTYAHEMIHAATSFAVRYMQGNNKFTHMLRTAYDLFLHNANAETIAEHLTQIPNIQERNRIANMLFNHMTKNEDSLTNLEEFLAIALTDKAMIEILQSIPYKQEENKNLFQKIRDVFFEIFDTIFGDNILKVKKDGSTYDMLVSLATQMGKINQNAKNEVAKNKSKLRQIIDFAREEMDEKLSGVMKTSLSPIKKFLVKEMITNTSDSWLGHIRYHAASGVLAMCSKDYQDNLRKELSDTYIALNNDTMLGAIIDDISTPSAMARLAQRVQRESSRIDGKRETYEYCTEQELKKLFKNPISEHEAQAMGEVLLDMDIASLDMSINEIQALLSNEATLDNKIKEFKNKINSKNLDQKYKNYIHNRSIALAYKMVTGKNVDNAVVLNAYNIVNCVGTNNRYGNPSTKYNKEFKNELVKDVDQYITLLALKLINKGTKESVANIISKDAEATKKVMNFINNFNIDSQRDLFKNNKIHIIKGYRRDVYNNDKEIIWADASREKELAKEGYKRISEPLSKNTSDNTNDTRCMYVNTFISQQTNFTRQAIRYTKGTSRGHEIRDLINHEIYENPERVNELERLYHKSMAEAKENFKRDISKAMNTEMPLDIKALENISKETNLQPILDEAGNVSSFSYQMSKEVKKDVLSLNTNIFKSLGKMKSNYYDKNASRDLNNRIVEILVNDYKVASKNPLELDKMFIELSYNTKDPLKREIYKMLDYETRTKLEKEMDGKIMVRKDTFAKFFGVRDMDIRNAKWFKKMSNVEVKKTIIFTAELLKMITKLFKLETVVRTPSVFIANQVSNIWQCMNYGIPLLDSLKLHREAVVNLRRYQEGKRKLMELELKVSAGEKVNEASINALRTSLKNNPVYPLVAHGFLNTIIEDLDKPVKGYFEEKYSKFYNNRSSIGKGIIDWAFLTEKTWLGKGLTEYVHMADFLSRYTLYYGLKNQGKLSETQIIDEVSDAFIDYDMITNRGIKMLNDYGFALFTRFFTRSQRLLKNHLVDRPFTTAALLVAQSHAGDVLNSSIYDTVFWNKNYDYMLGLANPIYNAIDVLSPSGLKFVPGMSDVMSTTNLRSSSMFI